MDGNSRVVSVEGSNARLAEAVDVYLAAWEMGEAPPEEEFLARYPELAPDLKECLASLRFIRKAAEAPRAIAAAADGASGDEVEGGTLGDFRILREVGRGGMGVVYEAEQISLGRRVALKVLPFAATMDPRHLQRFQNEARAVACLHHEHIVPVHAVGCERGVHFYAMQFIDGRTLADLISREHSGESPTTAYRPAPDIDTAPVAAAQTRPGPRGAAHFRRVAEWGIQAAEALEHAHSLGIVHRDVKPANLIIDGQGKLWVTDFGLARTATDAGLTMTGDLLGTLRYMSPEQAFAKHGLVDHRTDVYSLGVTLYEVLTGSPAVRGDDRQEILRRIEGEEPSSPRSINRSIPVDLETIIQKAITRDPQERYTTAKEFATDIERFLREEPIHARRATLLQKARKWAWRRRTLLGTATATAILCLIAGLFLVWTEKQRTGDALQTAETERGRAQARLQEALQVIDTVVPVLGAEPEDLVAQRDRIAEQLNRQLVALLDQVDAEPLKDVKLEKMRFRAHADLAEILKRNNRSKEAREQFQTAFRIGEDLLAVAPEDEYIPRRLARLQQELAFMLRQEKDYAGAEDAFRSCLRYWDHMIRVYPRKADIYRLVGNDFLEEFALFLCSLGRFQDAENCYRQAMETFILVASRVPLLNSNQDHDNFNIARFRTLVGWCLDQRGCPKEAEAEYRQALTLAPEAVDVLASVAWYRATASDPQSRNPAEAVRLARKAAELSDARKPSYNGSPWVYLPLALAHLRAGEYPEASKALDQISPVSWKEFDGRFPPYERQLQVTYFWLCRTMTFWNIGDRKAAREMYQRILKRDLVECRPVSPDLARFVAEVGELVEVNKENQDPSKGQPAR